MKPTHDLPRHAPAPHDATHAAPRLAVGRVAARAEARIAVNASAERVWQLLTGVDAWPRWNPAVARVRRGEPLAVGRSFVWTSQGFTVTSTVTELRPAERLAWTGRALGTRALHVWEIEPAARGVVVRTSEAFGGWLPALMPRTMQKKLDETLPAWLSALKAEAERAA